MYALIAPAEIKLNPDETVSLRTQQDATKGAQHRAVCERQTAQARAVPANADLQYLAARCNTDDKARNRAYLEGRRKLPRTLEVSWRNAPPLAETAALVAARLRRKEARNDRVDIRDLSAVSPWLKRLDNLETSEGLQSSSLTFSRLAEGRLDEALALAKGSNFESYVRMVAASDARRQTPSNAHSSYRPRALRVPKHGLPARWQCAMDSTRRLIWNLSAKPRVRVRSR